MRKVAIIRVATLLGFLAVWELLARSGLVLEEILPPPTEVLTAAFNMLGTEAFILDATLSAYEIAVGIVIGAAGGIACGALLGAYDYLYRLFEPLIYYFGAVPKIVLFPILILFLGTGYESKVGMAVISSFFPIIINSALSVREVNPVHVRAARSLGASGLAVWRKVYAPATMGPVLSGVRLGLGVAITATLLAETKVAQLGLGFRAVQYYSQLRIAEMYALLFLVFAGAALINWGLSYLIARTTHYQQPSATGTTSVA